MVKNPKRGVGGRISAPQVVSGGRLRKFDFLHSPS